MSRKFDFQLAQNSIDYYISLIQAVMASRHVPSVAIDLETTPDKVYKVLKRIDLKVSSPEEKYKSSLKSWKNLSHFVESVGELWLQGFSVSYIQKEVGIGRKRVCNIVRLAGSVVRNETGIDRLIPYKEAILLAYSDPKSNIRKIAQKYGVHDGTVTNFLMFHGVELKTKKTRYLGERNPQWKGGRESVDRDSGKYWGRKCVTESLNLDQIPSGWVVHHMNENPADQRPGNLWLFPSPNHHSNYHQQQLKNLSEGALISANHLASKTGGLWLQELIDLLQSSPDKDPLDLLEKRFQQCQFREAS